MLMTFMPLRESTVTLEEAQQLLHAVGRKLVIDGLWFYTNESLVAYMQQKCEILGIIRNYMLTHTNRHSKTYKRILQKRTLPRIKSLIPMLDAIRIQWDVVAIVDNDKQLKTAKDYQEVAV